MRAEAERCECGHLRTDHTAWWDDGIQSGMACTRCRCDDPDVGPLRRDEAKA